MITDSVRVCPDFQRRRVLCLLGGAALLLGSTLAHAAPAAATSAPAGPALTQIDLINLAVRQRTLIQRMTKLYAQILVGARTTDAKRLIQEAISRFDTLHTTHKSAASGMGSTNYQVTAVLDKISKAWAKLHVDIAKAPTEKALPDICSQCEDLSRLINQSTGASAQFLSGSPIGQLVDRSGKQCYLSQRIAKNYFLRALGQSAEEASREINDARKEFIDNATFLAKAPENTTEIKFLLQLGATQWPYFDDAVSQSHKSSTDLDYNVATTAENILEVLERTNLLYFKLSSST
ncbi:type IV pili methyl-accepting chemotaxis transducer N-terminal domain-containing protein [Uliginosibacterium gangwonense]|uniref:type IV pili methyl-accepting chemotaxis transducer N-terminal domain-containing protein n=1 Tax=Uliginosibacterium gangwonense TaxID=392736 RepID=UPI000376AE59|nr:type IV pili methyl-accepting chemotaxis transducer N-terminal domain-containing protein [Uliginosibacterium gangwonense]